MRGLTKSQRRRARERIARQEAEEFEQQMGPMPPHIVAASADFGTDLEIVRGQDAFERAPSHTVEAGECPSVDKRIIRDLSAQAAERRAERQSDRRNTILTHCRDLLGKRGNAEEIQNRLIENGEDAPSIRTIQRDLRFFSELATPPRVPSNKQ